jgi:hypothetical protein
MVGWADAVATLAPVVGSAGISGVLVAMFGFLRSARRGHPPDPAHRQAFAGILLERDVVERLASAIERAAEAAERSVNVENQSTDLLHRLASIGADLTDELRRYRRMIESQAPP